MGKSASFLLCSRIVSRERSISSRESRPGRTTYGNIISMINGDDDDEDYNDDMMINLDCIRGNFCNAHVYKYE